MKHFKISSQSNPRIKRVMDIRRRNAGKDKDLFLIEGPHLLEMAISSGAAIKEVFITENFSDKKVNQQILWLISQDSTSLFQVTDQIMDKIADTDTPQGIVAVVSQKPPALSKIPLSTAPLIVVVDGIKDPGNLGSIIRTSDAAGADAVILLPGACDIFMQKTIRASAGSIFNIPVVHADTSDLLTWVDANNVELAVTSLNAGESVFASALGKPLALVFGNEAHGVSEQLRSEADMFINIPIYGKAESLNVATSAAICLYEAVRQRRQHEQ